MRLFFLNNLAVHSMLYHENAIWFVNISWVVLNWKYTNSRKIIVMTECSIDFIYFFPCLKISFNFYTPVWKTGRIMPWQCPSVRLSVRLSVRPSVRPRFPDFFSTCFEISIWNLVYTFSRWHDMSSLSCITIGSLWPSLQPKVGQTYFFAIMAS